jgi:hypothetical protein
LRTGLEGDLRARFLCRGLPVLAPFGQTLPGLEHPQGLGIVVQKRERLIARLGNRSPASYF